MVAVMNRLAEKLAGPVKLAWASIGRARHIRMQYIREPLTVHHRIGDDLMALLRGSIFLAALMAAGAFSVTTVRDHNACKSATSRHPGIESAAADPSLRRSPDATNRPRMTLSPGMSTEHEPGSLSPEGGTGCRSGRSE